MNRCVSRWRALERSLRQGEKAFIMLEYSDNKAWVEEVMKEIAQRYDESTNHRTSSVSDLRRTYGARHMGRGLPAGYSISTLAMKGILYLINFPEKCRLVGV